MSKVVIIGGGITGIYTAWFLSRRGISVTVVDSPRTSATASDNNPGGINPLHGPGIPGDMEEFAMHSYRLHAKYAREISTQSGVDFLYRTISRIDLAFTNDDVERIEKLAPLYDRALGFSAQWLDPEQLRKTSASISDKALAGLLMEGNATVVSDKYRQALEKTAVANGMVRLTGHVEAIAHHGEEKLVTVSGKRIACSHLVIANGPWACELSRWVGLKIPVEPVKGQLLLVETEELSTDHDITWKYNGIYHIKDNRYWLGGTREHTGFDCSTTGEGKNAILATFRKVVPHVRDPRIVDHVAGLRAATPDGRPLLGRVPDCDNVFIAAGTGSKGMLLSSGMGQQIAELVVSGAMDTRFTNMNLLRFKEKSDA